MVLILRKQGAEAIERLTRDVESSEDDYLDYIITDDIFSEGTDIVEVNQVILLRPTQSPIVFIQQLGRGLSHLIKDNPLKALDFFKKNSNKFSFFKRFKIREKIVEKLEILNSSIIKFKSIYLK